MFKVVHLHRMVRKLKAEGAVNAQQADLFLARRSAAMALLHAKTTVLLADKRPAAKKLAQGLGDGQLLKKLWERREEILAFIREIVKLFG